MEDNKVAVFKLMPGYDVVGEIIETHPDGWVLNRPRIIDLRETQNGGMSLTLVPLVFINAKLDKPVKIYLHAVSAKVDELPEEFVREYLSFVSGIMISRGM